MSKLWITEFQSVGPSNSAVNAQIPRHPPVAVQVPIVLGASTKSAAFNSETTFVRLRCDAICHYVVGVDPTATTNDTPLDPNNPEYIGVPAGMKLAVIAG